MMKKLKYGLVGTSILLATAAYAAPTDRMPQEVKPVKTIEQQLYDLETLEQAESFYKQKIGEYQTSDNSINSDELTNLNKISLRKYDIAKEKLENLKGDYGEIVAAQEELRTIDEKLKASRSMIEQGNDTNFFDGVKKEIEDNILVYYPALFDKEKANMSYSANSSIEPGLNDFFKEAVVKVDQMLKEHYGRKNLDILLNKDEYRVKDIVILYSLIDKAKEEFKEKKTEEVKTKISSLEKDRHDFIQTNQELLSLNSEIESLEKRIKNNSYMLDRYTDYFGIKHESERFVEENGNFKRTLLLGPIVRDELSARGIHNIEKKEKHFDRNIKHSLESLTSHFKKLGYQVDIDDVDNPAKPIIPWGWAVAALFCFPIVRNIFVKSYIKGDDADGVEYFLTGLFGLVNGGVAALLAGFPYVVPVMMASPLIIQPLLKLMDADPCEDLAGL